MLTLDEIVERLNRKDVNYTHVQRETGLGYQTIRNIAMGKSSDPKLSTMMKLSEYFGGRAPVPENLPYQGGGD